MRTWGFPPVAALADKQLSTVWSFGQIDKAIFSLFQIPILIKQKGRTAGGAHPLCLVRMTGFEPTRISSLEPDGNVTSVETPVPVLSLFTCLL